MRIRAAALLLAISGCGRHEPAATSAPAPDPAPKAIAANPLAPCPVAQPTLGPGLTVERWPLGATTADHHHILGEYAERRRHLGALQHETDHSRPPRNP